jgi:hypothetical protein
LQQLARQAQQHLNAGEGLELTGSDEVTSTTGEGVITSITSIASPTSTAAPLVVFQQADV